MGTDLARFADAIPLVAHAAARDAAFPLPALNQRVQLVSTGEVQRWDGAEWRTVTAGPTSLVPAGRAAGLTSAQYLANNAVVNVRDFGAVGDGVANDAPAIQAAIDAASNNNINLAGEVFIPTGKYRCTSPLLLPKQFVKIRGAGVYSTELYFDINSSADYIARAQTEYLRTVISDFRIIGAPTATGGGLNLDGPLEVYQSEFKRLQIESGGAAIYGQRVFSTKFEQLYGSSTLDHIFKVHCGNTVAWRHCYAMSCPAGKAGYRLSGNIHLDTCNGLNAGGWWGIFGSNPTLADGYQNDFPAIGVAYPVIELVNCNLEEFSAGGVYINQSYHLCEIRGGKMDRNPLSTAFHSFVHARFGSTGVGRPIRLAPGYVFLGAGNPNGGAGLVGAYLITGGGAIFEDVTGQFAQGGVTKFRDTAAGVWYPLPSPGYTSDVFGDSARYYNGLAARRLSVNVVRYPALALTPGAAVNAVLDVTGYTKVELTPSGAYSVARATFTATAGTGAVGDTGRNGELVIEAGNGNVTIVHNFGSGDGFRLKAGAAKTLAQGEIIRFMRSANYQPGVAGWVEV